MLPSFCQARTGVLWWHHSRMDFDEISDYLSCASGSPVEIYPFLSLGLILESSDAECRRYNSAACLKKSIVNFAASKCENH